MWTTNIHYYDNITKGYGETSQSTGRGRKRAATKRR